MSTVKANTIEPASGGTVTIIGADLTTPALGTPASGTLTNCTGLPANTGLSGTTLASSVVNASINAVTPTGGTMAVTGILKSTGNLFVNTSSPINLWSGSSVGLTVKGTSFDAGKVTVSSSNANNCTGELVASYGSDVVALLAKGDAAYPAVQVHQVNGGTFRLAWQWDSSGNFVPGTDNAFSVGDGGARASVIYAATGSINTSDSRLKTPLRPLTSVELAAGLEIAKLGPGVFQFLDAVAEKGADRARLHVGYTVQAVMAIMANHGLDPGKYAFICHDSWDAEVVEHPAIEARPATPAVPAVYETREARQTVILDGQETELVQTYLHEVSPAVPAKDAVEAQPARTEVIREAGDRFSFRPDQLDRFINAAVIQAAIERLGL